MDIGGTFTDFMVVDDAAGAASPGKVSSTPANPAEGVIEGLRALVEDQSAIELIVHGTTVGINAFLERKGTRVLLIATDGLGDSYSIARGDRKELYALQYRKPERLVRRADVYEIRERLDWDGSVLAPLEPDSFGPVIERIRQDDIQAVAVCLIHAYVNPEHELRAREILQAAVPGLSVTLSHEVAREWREYERSSSAVLNAYIAPPVERYLTRLEDGLTDLGVRPPLHVMQSNGGITTARRARELPIQTLLSGPVGGAIGGAALARATGRPNLLCVDMGGTSFDLSLVVDGRPSVSTETQLEGLPVLMPLVDIHTVGAGGGSIAFLEAGGLRVGPHSAGADPGPACYGRGGTRPTVTDANLLLGRLDPGYFLGGRMRLDEDAARRAAEPIAAELGLGEIAFAEGVLAVVNAAMADAMRTITVKQGIDPRAYALVAFGGAGPMHACWLAAELGIGEVIVPWSAGAFSAWGMLQTDMRQDLARTFYRPMAGLEPADMDAVFAEMATEGAELLREQGVDDLDLAFARTADMRYVGQEYAVNVSIGAEIDLATVEADFHAAYRTRYGHATPGAPVEFAHLRLAALGRIRGDAIPFRSNGSGDPSLGTRAVTYDGEPHDTPILLRDRLAPGATHAGPAVIEEDTTTTVVPPGWRARLDEHGNLVLERT
jgi:N-methylhydantoinase A